MAGAEAARAAYHDDQPRLLFIGGLVMRIDRISGAFGARIVVYSSRGNEI